MADYYTDAEGNPIAPASTEATQTQQQGTQYGTTNTAKDDNPAAGSNTAGATNVRPPNTANEPTPASSGQKKSGFYNFSDRRRFNPLRNFSSHTYNITLYMVEPTKMNEFFENYNSGNAVNINQEGFYIVAQSGGVNNSTENRAITLSGIPGKNPGYDFYIEDLKIEQILPTFDGSHTPTVDMDIQFKIVEPTGFNFLFQLNKASRYIVENDEIIPKDVEPNIYQQMYMIGVRFYGYDENGELLEAKKMSFNDSYSSISDPYAVYERFFPIELTELKFKLDGRATTYDIKAVPLILQGAFGAKHNVIEKNFTITAKTVGEALLGKEGQSANGTVRGLVQVLNDEQAKQVEDKRKKYPDVYKIVFDEKAKKTILNAKLVDTWANYDKKITTMNSPNRTNEGTVGKSAKTKTIDISRIEISANGGKTVTQMIDNIITSSSFVTDSLNQRNDDQIETDTYDNPTINKIKWYTIAPQIKLLKRDPITNDWVREITYVIKEYWMPYLRSPYAPVTVPFYGAVKKYDYWYTGQNTEIQRLEFQYNNLFYMVIPYSTSQDFNAGNGGQGNVPQSTEGGSNADTTGGKTNRYSEFNQNINAQIYNMGDNNEMTFTMLGDPDFLMSTLAATAVNKSDVDQLFGPGYVIDPMGGEIFIEIVFRSAYDYLDDGTLGLTNPVVFYQKNEQLRKEYGIDGAIFMLTQCDSTFSRGSFTQQFTGILCDEEILLKRLEGQNNDGAQREESAPDLGGIGGSGNPIRQGRQGGATAQNWADYWNRQNRPDLRYPQSSLAKGVEQTLNKKYNANSTWQELSTSPAYYEARRSGKAPREALAIAREKYGGTPTTPTNTGPVANDDAVTTSNPRQVNNSREGTNAAGQIPSGNSAPDPIRNPAAYEEYINNRLLRRERGGGG